MAEGLADFAGPGVLETWRKVAQDRKAHGMIPNTTQVARGSKQSIANQQAQTWHRGLERFTRLNVKQVTDELAEMGIGTFARGVLLAMEGPTCPLCHRGGEVWAYQTFAKVAKIIGEDGMAAAAMQAFGVSLDVLTKAVALYQRADGASVEGAERTAREYLEALGWRCLPPAQQVQEGS